MKYESPQWWEPIKNDNRVMAGYRQDKLRLTIETTIPVIGETLKKGL